MESSVQSVVSKFGKLLADELQEIRGVGVKVVYLMDELDTMNSVLRMLSEADESSVDHLARSWAKQVRELAYDSEDCIDIYWLRVRRPIPFLPYIVKWPKYQFEKLLLQRALAADVRALLARTAAVNERRIRYAIDRQTISRSPCFDPVPAASASARSLRPAADSDQFVGIRDKANHLAQSVNMVTDDDKKLKVFSIVEFGGLGKTTMAMELCRRLEPDFHRQAVVSVSQVFDERKDIKGLLARLLQQILKVKEDKRIKKLPFKDEEIDKMNVVALASTFKELLEKRNEELDEMDTEKLDSTFKKLLENKRSFKKERHTEELLQKLNRLKEEWIQNAKRGKEEEEARSRRKKKEVEDFRSKKKKKEEEDVGGTDGNEQKLNQIDNTFQERRREEERLRKEERLNALVILRAVDGLVEEERRKEEDSLRKEECLRDEEDEKLASTFKELLETGRIDDNKDLDVEKLAHRLQEFIKKIIMEDWKSQENLGVEDVVIQSHKHKVEQMGVEEPANTLKDVLNEKRYLIVVDDVWSVPAWEAIRFRLPENKYGSRNIVTTRIGTVAKAASDSVNFIHHMEPLESAASEKLFVQRVFGSTKMRTCSEELEPFMDKILKQCGGLPLAIISIASLLASYNSAKSINMWKRVSNSIGLEMESHPTLEGMRQLIALSYDYLPHHLKPCMMYMSIFPEDRVIAKNRLLYRWIAEGLIAKKRGLTLLEVAEDYFNELISRNMIQPDKLVVDNWINERVEACRVHDMMLEVMVSKSLENNFVSLLGRQYREMTYGKVRRLSVHDDAVERRPEKRVEQRLASARHGIEAMKLHHVRSLTTFESEGLKKLLDRLGEFKLLRVLDLEGCMCLEDKHMRDVCRLYLLRFLILRGTKISVMPSKVGDLEHLETLDVEKSRIKDLPPTVTMLSRLEFLKCDSWTLPRGLEKMKALREVSKAILGDDIQIAREIGELQQLQVLIIELTRRDLDPEERFWFALGSSLSKTYSLRWLHMEGSTSSTAMNALLRVTSPPPLLQRLTINGAIRKMPEWILSLAHLVEFSTEGASLDADQIFDVLCKLPNLQSIELGTCSCIDQELIARSAYKFPELRILNVSATSTSPQVLRFEEDSMNKVEQLVLSFNRDKRILDGINNLKNLKEVKLNGRENDPALLHALNQLKRENESRSKYNQIKIVADYR